MNAGAVPGWVRQAGHRVRFDWGADGLMALAPDCEVVVVVDVLRFTTCVEVAVARGAAVHPYAWRDDGAAAHARAIGAELAGDTWSLSPAGLQDIPAGTRLVLPSPNGSALSRSAADHGTVVVAGCFRNASAVGRAVAALVAGTGGAVAVVAAGERWHAGGTGPLRPAVEDLWGAGAVVAAAAGALGPGSASPEAATAAAAFGALDDLPAALRACASGQELLGRDRRADVELAGLLDVSATVPVLVGGAFRDTAGDVGELGP